MEACARLHNFVIEQDWDDFDDDEFDTTYQIEPMEGSPLGWGYLPTVEPLQAIPGTSQTWDAIL